MQPNYLKIEGRPVFSVFSLENLIKTFGTVEETKKGLAYFIDEAKKAGFSGVHFQITIDGIPQQEILDQITMLGINSVTHCRGHRLLSNCF